MSTANITWVNASPSNPQELYYGKDALVTGFPNTGTGWVADSNNPLPASTGSETITNLNDNVKYKFLVKTDCTNSQNIFSQSTAIKWVYQPIQTTGPTGGTLSYVLPIDPSVSNSGSIIGEVVVTLSGIDKINNGVLIQQKVYTAPFSSSYTDQFNNVNGDVNWTLKVAYKTSSYPSMPLYDCSTQSFSTTSAPGTSYLQIRNALALGILGQITIATTNVLGQTLDAGYASKIDISSLITGGAPLQTYCTLPSTLQGTQLIARQIRAGTQINGGLFTYSGSNTPISSVPWALQNGDLVEITDYSSQAYIYKQTIITKTSTPSLGYNVSLTLDISLADNNDYDIYFTAFDYSSGASEPLVTNVTTQGGSNLPSSIQFVPTTLTAAQFANATITSLCINSDSASVGVPYYYNCNS